MNTTLSILIAMLLFSTQLDGSKKVLGKWIAVKATNELNQPCSQGNRYITFLQNSKFEMSLSPESKMNGYYSIGKNVLNLTKINSNDPYSRKNFSMNIPISKSSNDSLVLKYTACPASDSVSAKTGEIVFIKSK